MSRVVLRASATLALILLTYPAYSNAAHQIEDVSQVQQSQPQQNPGSATARAPLVYMVRYRPGPNYRPEKSLLEQDLREHGAYMSNQTIAGLIIAAGPTFDQAGGLVLISVANLAEAQSFVRNDPAVAAGIFAVEITDWRPVFDAKSIFRQEFRKDRNPKP